MLAATLQRRIFHRQEMKVRKAMRDARVSDFGVVTQAEATAHRRAVRDAITEANRKILISDKKAVRIPMPHVIPLEAFVVGKTYPLPGRVLGAQEAARRLARMEAARG